MGYDGDMTKLVTLQTQTDRSQRLFGGCNVDAWKDRLGSGAETGALQNVAESPPLRPDYQGEQQGAIIRTLTLPLRVRF